MLVLIHNLNTCSFLSVITQGIMKAEHHTALSVTLRCVIPIVCVTNEREESVVNQHN